MMLLITVMACMVAAQRPVLVTQKSVDSTSAGGRNADISADGRFVVFESGSHSIVSYESHATLDIFVRDLQTSTSSLVSINHAGTGGGNGASSNPAISADGRYIAFESLASDLVPNDNNGAGDIFVRDLATGVTTLVSVNAAGSGSGNQSSFNSIISENGRFVTFESSASNLAAGDNNGKADVFVRDLQTLTTSLVSVNAAGTGSGNGASFRTSEGSFFMPRRLPKVISADGRFIVFESFATDLAVTPDTNTVEDVFVRDMQAGVTSLLSVNTAGTGSGNSKSYLPTISANGQVVVFVSFANNLIPGDSSEQVDLFARNLVTGKTSLVTVAKNGTATGGLGSFFGTEVASVSADGRYVVFQSSMGNLVDKDTNGSSGFQLTDVFVRDLQAEVTTLISINSAGTDSSKDTSSLPRISADGRFVVFRSGGRDLISNPVKTNNVTDIFVRDLQAKTTTLVSSDYLGRNSLAQDGPRPLISADGRIVVFECNGSLLPTDPTLFEDVYAVGWKGQFEFSSFTYAAGENEGAATITVNRKAGSSGGAATLTYTASNGAAKAGSDFLSTSGTVSFAAGEMSKTFIVPLLNDTTDEPDETISLNLGDVNGAATTDSLDTALLTVTDDDAPPSLSINDVSAKEGEGINSGTPFTITLSAVSGKTVSVEIQPVDGTAVRGRDYIVGANSVTFAPGETSKTVAVGVFGDFLNQPDKTFFLNLVNPVNATIGDGQGQFTILNDDTPTLQFSQASYQISEGAASISIVVTRSGDSTAPATVKYMTSDSTDANFRCDPATSGQATGIASRKCDYHIAVGTLRFSANQRSKQLTVSIVNDVYVEGPETFTLTLSSPRATTVGPNNSVAVTILDDDAGVAANPIDNTRFFVRQLYVDLLSREPDPAGWNGWTDRINLCGQPGQAPPPCDRVTVGGDGFLRSGEFFDRQFFVLRLYRTGLGRILRYDEVADLAYVSGFLTDTELELNKQDLVNEMVTRDEFAGRYNPLSNAAFVPTLLQTAGVSVPQSVQDGWIAALDANTKTRAQVFREISERPEVSARYAHEAQVVSAYYGFFTRNPDGAYLNYLQRLDSGEINLSDLANAFINAQEYRLRFGQ